MSRSAQSSAGLSLIELIVVLTILAALAGTALVSTEGLVDQSRYDATRDTLTHLEDAILGSAPGPAGAPWLPGFVADMGRLPRATDVNDPGDDEDEDEKLAELASELWVQPAAAPAFAIQRPDGDPEIQLPAGWRGPYLRLPLGSAELRDGWGRPIRLLDLNGQPFEIDAAPPAPTLGDTPAAFGSWGADQFPDPAPPAEVPGYDKDQTVPMPPQHLGVLAAGGLPVRVIGVPVVSDGHGGHDGLGGPGVTGGPAAKGGPGAPTAPIVPGGPSGSGGLGGSFALGDKLVVVRVYGPRDGEVVTLAQYPGPGSTPKWFQGPDAYSLSLLFQDLPIGPRALRVYLTDVEPPADLDPESPLDGSNGGVLATQRSEIIPLFIPHGGLPEVVVEFP